MKSRRAVPAAWCLPVLLGMWAGLACGQEPSGEMEEEALLKRRGSLTWLKLGGEWRGRWEAVRNGDFVGGHGHEYWLNRLRLGVEVEPRNWVRVHVEGIDARLKGNVCPGEDEGFTNATELYQAYVEAGGEGQRARLRVGRMELAYGDERLIGSDRKMSPYGQVFAGAAGGVKWGPTQWDAFTMRLMAPDAWHMDRRDRRSKLHGVYGSIPWEGLVVEPYLIVKDVPWEAGVGVHHVYTMGARSAGPVAPRVTYNAEAAWQRGHRGLEGIAAKAVHAELGWQTGDRRRDPAVSVEYNFGSGDTNPRDGRHGSFDDLYPAGFNRFGMADAFAWINIHNAMAVGEWTLSKKWQVAGGVPFDVGGAPGGCVVLRFGEHVVRESGGAEFACGSRGVCGRELAASGRVPVGVWVFALPARGVFEERAGRAGDEHAVCVVGDAVLERARGWRSSKKVAVFMAEILLATVVTTNWADRALQEIDVFIACNMGESAR